MKGEPRLNGPYDLVGADSGKRLDSRGRPILHDIGNWRKKYREWAIGICGRFFFIIAIFYFFLYPLYILDGAQYLDDGATYRNRAMDYPTNTMIFYVVLGVFTFILFTFLTRKPVPAIYEQGIQLPHGKFIPYSFINSMQRVRKGIVFKKDLMTFHPRSVEEMEPHDPLMLWVINFDIIGDEGEALIRKNIHKIRLDYHPIDAPPRLIIYGPKDDSL